MFTRLSRLALVCLFVVAGAACLDDVTGTRIASISLSSDVATAMIGDTVTISYMAEGTGLAQVAIQFGDGEEELKTYSGPLAVTDFTTHVYTSAGSYEVVAEVISAAGEASDTVTVTVN